MKKYEYEDVKQYAKTCNGFFVADLLNLAEEFFVLPCVLKQGNEEVYEDLLLSLRQSAEYADEGYLWVDSVDYYGDPQWFVHIQASAQGVRMRIESGDIVSGWENYSWDQLGDKLILLLRDALRAARM